MGNRDFRLSGLVFGASVRAVHNSIQLAAKRREHEDTSDSGYARNCASNAVHVAILQSNMARIIVALALLGGAAAHELPLLTRAPVPPPLDAAHHRGESTRQAVARDEAIPG